VSLATSLPCHLAIRGPPQSLCRCTYAVQSALYFAQTAPLRKNSPGVRATGHYLRTVTPEIKPDDLNQIAQSAGLTMMANRVQWTVLESGKIRTRASWWKGRFAVP
jgi:hypothetical protein